MIAGHPAVADALFGGLQVTQLGVVPSAPLAMRAACTGGATALVVNWGNTLQITPICDGTVESMAVRTLRFGGGECEPATPLFYFV